MNIMKKVWVYKRRDIKSWCVGWYESGKSKARADFNLNSIGNLTYVLCEETNNFLGYNIGHNL
jgi:hypothetical protein